MRAGLVRGAVMLGVAGGAVLAGTLLRQPTGVKAETEVTWRRQIAPIVYKNCTSCHHAGGSGPFSLTEYKDAKRFASVIDVATSSRYMPPWLPEPGHDDFADSRRLPDEDLALLHAWVKAGAPEGTGPVPEAPQYRSEWALGTPDLVLETAEPIHIAANGSDQFVNVILHNPLTGTRWVRAMEIKPGSPQVVHHANVILDPTGSLRRSHADWRGGIPGMDIEIDAGDAFEPDSHFLFWKPDSTALVEPAGMPWKLEGGGDLVLNLHLKPTGKAETTNARIGLYFTAEAATKHPILLQLEADSSLDIPAGATSFVVQDQLTLPVAVEVLGVYPHAHYLARRMEAWAMLPDGVRKDLVLIKEWDIDRQSVYRLREPLKLPAGTTLHMRYVYDNSSANVRNPHTPAVRVKAGNRSEDEMAHFWVQVLPLPPAGMTEEEAQQKLEKAWMEAMLRKSPRDAIATYNLAALDLASGEAGRATELYRRLLQRTPGDVRARTALGAALAADGEDAGAEREFRAALATEPTAYDARFDLAALELRGGQPAQAEALLRECVTAQPEDDGAHRLLAQAYAGEGKSAEAAREQREVVRLTPGSARDLNDLGVYEVRAGDRGAAGEAFAKALALDPTLEEAAANLRRVRQ